MFCPQCGTSNLESAAVCVQCGRNLQPSVPVAASGTALPPQTTVPNYLVYAIVSTVLCCIPAGIPAIVYAAQVNSKLLAGDLAGAQAASKNAKMWCWISFGLGLATIGSSILLMIVGMLSRIHH
jgi:hypothetical protein